MGGSPSPMRGPGSAPGVRAGDGPAPALARLALALVDVEALSGALGSSPRVAPGWAGSGRPADLAAAQTLIDRLAGELGVRAPRVVADRSGLVAAELAISNRMGRTELLGTPTRFGDVPDVRDVPDVPDVRDVADVPDALVTAAARQARRHQPAMTLAAAKDGSTLRCYASGPADGPAVALVSACGMPVGLLRSWISGLRDRFRVVTWESRGLFATAGALDEDFDRRGYDVPTQAGDLLAVLDAFGVDAAHVVGLCGGAAVALAADFARVRSLSLWHGDYELGPGVPKTSHQQDVQCLMLMAGRHRKRAAGLHALLSRPVTLESLRPDLAHHLIYPYASPELLYRYGRLNGAIMTTDCRPLLAAVDVPTLVVSSMADTTAHPEGSVFVAADIIGARLELMPEGDHLAAFDAAPEMIELARGFLDHAQEGAG